MVLLAAGVHRRRHRRLLRAAGRAVAADSGGADGCDTRLARTGGVRTTLASLLIAALLAGSLGFALAKLRVEWVRAPVLTKQINAAEVRGFVEQIEARPARGQRLTLRVTALGDLPEAARPARVRVTTHRALPGLQPGTPCACGRRSCRHRSRRCRATTTSGARRGSPASAPSAIRCRHRCIDAHFG